MAAADRPTSDEIKTVRKAMRKSYNTRDHKQKWKGVYENLKTSYGFDPNKSSKSSIGKGATTHILDSIGLREELEENTPINSMHEPIIPQNCDLTFHYQYNLSEYYPLCKCINLSQLFGGVSEMKNIFNDRLYSSQLVIGIRGTNHTFWIKSFKKSGSAFVKAFGVQISSYIMRYRPVLYVLLGAVVMVLRGKNIGIGFCNLVQTKKDVEGNQMMQFQMETMDEITVQFYSNNRDLLPIDMEDITMKVQIYEQKCGKIRPTETMMLHVNEHNDAVMNGDQQSNSPQSSPSISNSPSYDQSPGLFDAYNNQINQSPSSTVTPMYNLLPDPVRFTASPTPFPPAYTLTQQTEQEPAQPPLPVADLFAPQQHRTFQHMHHFNDPYSRMHRALNQRNTEESRGRQEAHIMRMRNQMNNFPPMVCDDCYPEQETQSHPYMTRMQNREESIAGIYDAQLQRQEANIMQMRNQMNISRPITWSDYYPHPAQECESHEKIANMQNREENVAAINDCDINDRRYMPRIDIDSTFM